MSWTKVKDGVYEPDAEERARQLRFHKACKEQESCMSDYGEAAIKQLAEEIDPVRVFELLFPKIWDRAAEHLEDWQEQEWERRPTNADIAVQAAQSTVDAVQAVFAYLYPHTEKSRVAFEETMRGIIEVTGAKRILSRFYFKRKAIP
jgi:hypothetical protein